MTDTFYPPSKDDARLIVRDMTDFFNHLAKDVITDRQTRDLRMMNMHSIVSDFTKLVDYRIGTDWAVTTARANMLESFELAAMEFVKKVQNTQNPHALGAAYAVMRETRDRLNLPMQFRMGL